MLCATALATVWAFGWPASESARTIERTIQISTTGEIGDATATRSIPTWPTIRIAASIWSPGPPTAWRPTTIPRSARRGADGLPARRADPHLRHRRRGRGDPRHLQPRGRVQRADPRIPRHLACRRAGDRRGGVRGARATGFGNWRAGRRELPDLDDRRRRGCEPRRVPAKRGEQPQEWGVSGRMVRRSARRRRGFRDLRPARRSTWGTAGAGRARLRHWSQADAARSARQAGVVYNPRMNEYLVTWVSDHLNDDENEIFAQRLSAQGTPGTTSASPRPAP